jgi:hypothetical protein
MDPNLPHGLRIQSERQHCVPGQPKHYFIGNEWEGLKCDIRYFFISDQVKKGDLHIQYCPTGDMLGDSFAKPLQGSLFCKLRKIILNLPDDPIKLHSDKHSESKMTNAAASHESAETRKSYADVV